MSRILTGLRANGDFHLGNYLGSMQPMVNLQSSLMPDDNLKMFIADLHSFTTPIDHDELNEKIQQNVKMYLAAGLDAGNTQTTIYRQSFVPAHSELAWILSCFTGFGELSRMVEFKDKALRVGDKSVSSGLLFYPVLMAADILLYDAEYIPLGDDQKQHLELSQILAKRINKKFDKEIFTVPRPWAKQLEFTSRAQGIRIKSLQDPKSKMSKSISDPKGTINLLDPPETAQKKIMSATTDSIGKINLDAKNQPGLYNLMTIHSLLTGASLEDVASEWEGKTQYGEFKKAVAESVSYFLAEFQSKYNSITDDEVEKLLIKGEERANTQAKAKLAEIQALIGLRR